MTGSTLELLDVGRGFGDVVAADGVPLGSLERLPAVEGVAAAAARVSVRARDPNRTVRALVDAVPALHGLEVTGTDLEEAFVALTQEDDS